MKEINISKFSFLKYVIVLVIFLFICDLIFKINFEDSVVRLNKDLSNYVEESINDNISYPYFDNEWIDNKVSMYVSSINTSDVLRYDVHVDGDVLNVFFVNLDNDKEHYYTINYDISKSKFLSDKDVFDFNTLGDEVLDIVRKKYSTKIYDSILKDNFNNAYVDFNDKDTVIHFDSSIFDDSVLHKVYVSLGEEDSNFVNLDKTIAFTFDDGPSVYTTDIVNTLILNDSKATFFELGNRMKYNQDTVREIYNLGMEIGSHTYSHKNLNELSLEEILSEVNSTNIIFNEITGDDIKYIRPPYGNYGDKVKEAVNVPLILWDVDTNDWLYRDSEKVYNHILEKAEDGDIILMHDIYPETLEAVKMVLPVLRERGFRVTTISELASIRGKNLIPKNAYRSI